MYILITFILFAGGRVGSLSAAWSYFPFPNFFLLWIQYTVTGVPMERSSGGFTRHSSGTLWVFPSYLGELLSFHVTQMYDIANSQQSYMYHAVKNFLFYNCNNAVSMVL